MRPSIVGTTYDLLTFKGKGNFGHFDRAFTKACDYFSLNLDNRIRPKLRNFSLHHLRMGGYLDVSYAAGKAEWTAAPAALVQRSETDFVLIGGSGAVAALLATAPKEICAVLQSREAVLPIPGELSFYPHIVQVTARTPEINALANRTGLSISLLYQDELFRLLPSMKSILEKALACEEVVFDPDSTDRFDFSSSEWERYPETRPFEVGLYRQSFDYGASTYFIAAKRTPHGLETFRVKEREWALVAALAKLNVLLPLRFEQRVRRLSVLRRYHQKGLSFPTLLERSLRSGTLMNPSINADWFAYDAINPSSVWRLAAKLPIFQIEAT